MSHKTYANNAERQRAFRERRRASSALDTGIRSPTLEDRPRREPSRPARILAHAEDFRKLAAEYQNWLDSLPRNLAEGATAARLEEFIAQLDEVAEAIEGLEPPSVGR